MGIKLPVYIELLDTRLKNPLLKTARYKGRLIHSLYDPVQEARDELLAYKDLDKFKVVIILGFGLGYLLDALLEKSPLPDRMIFVVEAEEGFRSFRKRDYPLKDISFFFHEKDEVVLDKIISGIRTIPFREILFLENRVLTETGKEYYAVLKEKLLIHFKQQVADITTTSCFMEEWLTNSFLNFKRAGDFVFIRDLRSRFSGQTALLVSSGPSLEKDLEWVKQYKGVIFALAPSLRFLLKNKVVPDFVVLGDSSYSNLYHLKDCLGLGLNLICDLSVHHSLFSLWKGLSIIISYHLPGLEFYYSKYSVPCMPQGGTVASTALYIIRYLGFKDLLLTGQDFAYTDLKLHVRGSGYEKYDLNRLNRRRTFFNMNFNAIRPNQPERRGTLLVDRKMELYREWFGNVLKFLGLTVVSRDKAKPGKKMKNDLQTIPGLDLRNELKDLRARLSGVRMDTDLSIEEFMDSIRKDPE
ncbi:MAG: DUF115 domain-containing protein, partial [bacterium]|nr:DUF115 domain-containing protein [bacterium]